jgi:hypothetical protein
MPGARAERAFCTCSRPSQHALDKPPRARPDPLPLAAPRPKPRCHSRRSTAPPSGRPWRLADGRSRPRPWQRRPSHTHAPARPLSSVKFVGVRRPAPTASTSPCSNRMAVRRRPYPRPRNRPRCAIYGDPRAHPSTQATSGHPHRAPTASNRRGEAIFLVSGQFGCRHFPAPFVASRPSPTFPAPPPDSPRPRGAAQPLKRDQKSP